MDLAKINQFIESYRQKETLWNVHCPDYHNRVKRIEAIARQANEYNISRILVYYFVYNKVLTAKISIFNLSMHRRIDYNMFYGILRTFN